MNSAATGRLKFKRMDLLMFTVLATELAAGTLVLNM
jgi:hypothetical protein